ncbi:hypothetical protein SHANETTE_58 [Bacillus phage Shanette]|uniref:Uncharacterized protein n=2 Tax=Siminovitchvirus TaxID=1918721 RepID=S5MMH5_9CAUD|nr:hypothetical protein AVV47_gp058 [Bacillus phage JL]YP_009216056.1 hypothetical protein AVV46_gp058 [Bacillus phage Shanette]AGR46920.1 hypothetical protein JL_58 [Bacillus phage JL]AGR46958.1 hypothetical protein SHANETTE_58 [Bacillus phage Shanette]
MMETFGTLKWTDIEIPQQDIPEPYLSLKKHLLDVVWDETQPIGSKEKASKQLQELDKQILMYLLTQPLRIVIKKEE